ncbi:MAG TPA: hypothetical protein VJ385_01520 [Fibrobacteria bacterium]|nr:hypothetical protein [Fibrobacteria bacterium]
MAQKKSNENLDAVRKRLRAGELTAKDVELLDKLTLREQELRDALKSAKKGAGGKRILAQLPFGMDLVK